MTFRLRWLGDGLVLLAFVGLTAGAVWMLQKDKAKPLAAKPTPPAAVSKQILESDLTTITLTPEAEKRLGVRTGPVVRKPVHRTRTLGGEVTIPAGKSMTVAAPLSGTLRAPPGGGIRAGQNVKAGQPLFLLAPILTPESRATLAASRVDAEGQVKTAQTSVDAAKVAQDRAQRLVNQEAGSRRGLDEAQAAFEIASKTLDAARARLELLTRVLGDLESGTAAPITIESPATGMLRNELVAVGETVPTAAPLFEVAALDTLWVRVPIYVGDLAEIASDQLVRIGGLADRPGAKDRTARPVAAPPSANALAATVDLYYEIDNVQRLFAPGQRVGVTLPLKGESENLTVPWAAIVHDVHGGTWVYEAIAPHMFARRRVAVRAVIEDAAILEAGPKPGTLVVIEAAAELFGTEFGIGK